MNIKKAANLFRLLGSFILSRLLQKELHSGAPLSLSIEPTTACNLRCPECPSGLKQFTRKEGNMSLVFFKEVLEQVKDELMNLNLYFQGEPFINPDFFSMIAYAHEKGIYTMTSTNAHFLDEERARKTVECGLDKLIVSIDGTTQQVYEQYRVNGQLALAVNGMKQIARWKSKLNCKKPHIILQCIVFSHNEHQMDDILRQGKKWGANQVQFKTAQIYNLMQNASRLPDEKFSRYRKKRNGVYAIDNKLRNHCWRMWSSCVITWDGLVVPCCFDKDARYHMGDLKKESFRSIWRGAAYHAFRSSVIKNRKAIDICTNCSEGSKIHISKNKSS